MLRGPRLENGQDRSDGAREFVAGRQDRRRNGFLDGAAGEDPGRDQDGMEGAGEAEGGGGEGEGEPVQKQEEREKGGGGD